MKKLCCLLAILILITGISGCRSDSTEAQIVATTLPVFEFTSLLCENTGLSVSQLVTQSVSCLHDYTLQVDQMRMVENADLIVISGAGLEDFLDGVLDSSASIIDASENTHIHSADHTHEDHHGHFHDSDPHIWLSPENAKNMAHSICHGLCEQYPQYSKLFTENLETLLARLNLLQAYGDETLGALSCRELITFHDGFAYFAESFDLTILRAIEEESGSEASAAELIELIHMVNINHIPAVFTEENGSTSAAEIIAAETGVRIYELSMAMSGESYFDAMYRNIDAVKEALE